VNTFVEPPIIRCLTALATRGIRRCSLRSDLFAEAAVWLVMRPGVVMPDVGDGYFGDKHCLMIRGMRVSNRKNR
jgi:hypothetical protein